MELMDDMAGTVFATGRSVTRPAHRVQVQEQDRQPFEVFWDVTFSPWFADDGSVRGVLFHGVDVTDATRGGRMAPDSLRDVVALQDALLPDWLPVLPGVEIAGRYLLAENELMAGGDWYDAIGVPAVAWPWSSATSPGHGVAASAAMGRLRAVAQERLISGAGLEQVMLALDSFARCIPEASAATICVLVLDPVSGEVRVLHGRPPTAARRTS